MANKLTMAERMIKLETNVDNLKGQVEAGFTDVKNDLKLITATVQNLVPTLVTQAQLAEKVTDLDKEILVLKKELHQAKSKNTIQTWITSTLSAILAVVLTVLIQSYFRG